MPWELRFFSLLIIGVIATSSLRSSKVVNVVCAALAAYVLGVGEAGTSLDRSLVITGFVSIFFFLL